MIQIDEQKLRQLFKNRSNCYADAEDVVQAMDEDCFIETVNEALRLFAVSGRSEQLIDFAIKNGYIEDMPKGNKMGLINKFEKSINCH